MGVLTNLLKLLKPGENDYYNQQTEQADNWDKVDNYAVLTNADKNGVWGGEYGGKIQDPIPKELNKRYIDNINGKAFICIKAGDSSVTSNTIEYFTPCNVVDNLDKLQNLSVITRKGNHWCKKNSDGTMEQWGFYGLSVENGVVEITYPEPFLQKIGLGVAEVTGFVVDSDSAGISGITWTQFKNDKVMVYTKTYGYNLAYHVFGWWK